MEFLLTLLPQFRGALGEDAAALEQAGGCLMQLLTLIRAHPVTMPPQAIQLFYDSAKRYLFLVVHVFGLSVKPKDHMLIHMVYDIAHKGSPAYYGNWIDESLNKLLRDVSAGAHSLNHDRRVLVEFPRALEMTGLARRVRQRTD